MTVIFNFRSTKATISDGHRKQMLVAKIVNRLGEPFLVCFIFLYVWSVLYIYGQKVIKWKGKTSQQDIARENKFPFNMLRIWLAYWNKVALGWNFRSPHGIQCVQRVLIWAYWAKTASLLAKIWFPLSEKLSNDASLKNSKSLSYITLFIYIQEL